jgi:hypothetical protein
MNQVLTYLLVFLLVSFSVVDSSAQGCSDAGFCTIGAMRPGQPYTKDMQLTLKSVELSQYVGVTKLGDKIYATTLDINLGVTDKDAIQFKLPYMAAEGSLGYSQGVGDVSLGYTRILKKTAKYQFNVTGGAKIALGKSDKEFEGKPLPMYYQQNLGTYDAILGFSLLTSKWLVATGLQYPLTANSNQFVWKPWLQDGTSREEIEHYPSSIDLDRGKDVMLRVERSLRKSNWRVNVGLLGIYRLNRDERTNPKTKVRELVAGTDGLALTALLGLNYSVNVNSSVKLIYGQRIVKRNVSLDGLSREQVVEVGYVYRF